MNAVVKFHNIAMIEDNRDGTVTIHYRHTLSTIKAINAKTGQKTVKLGELYTITVEKGQLVNYYV